MNKLKGKKSLVADTARLLKAEPSGETAVKFLNTLYRLKKITAEEMDEIFETAEARAFPRFQGE